MKSEKIRRAIGEIDDDIIEAADGVKVSGSNKKIWVRRAVIAAAAVLLLTGAIALPGVLKQNAPVVDKPPAVENDGKTGAETVPETDFVTDVETGKRKSPDIAVIWADDGVMDVNHPVEDAFTKWNRFDSVTLRLYEALEAGDGDDVFAILARPAVDYDFEYSGRTVAEYYSDKCNEELLPDLLTQLLKEGDALKYGEALCETGTPTGEKWDRSLYEERVKFYGPVLEKYIVGGEFLKEQLERDLEEAKTGTKAAESYGKAISAYLDSVAASVGGELPAEAVPEQYGLIMYLTKDGFSSFKAENVEGWTFDLAVKNGDTVEYAIED